MNLKNGAVLLVAGVLSFAARKRGRGRHPLFGRLAQSQPSPSISLDPDFAEALEREARALLAQGRKIEAVKYVREYTNWGLKEAKDFVDALGNDSSASEVTPVGITAEVRAKVHVLVQQGRVIEAVKQVRAATGWGLKEAKDYVDRLR